LGSPWINGLLDCGNWFQNLKKNEKLNTIITSCRRIIPGSFYHAHDPGYPQTGLGATAITVRSPGQN
jgi:hypothetical protein